MMSDAARISAQAISALLDGLASALTDAQQSMADMPPYDAFGRPLPSYRIPELDFTFEIETIETNSPANNKRWLLQPSNASSGQNTISSTISGKIVAIPPNGGLPQAYIYATQQGDNLVVHLSNSAGEILPETPIELEFDANASEALYGTKLEPAQRLALLAKQQTQTDETGIAMVGITRSALPSKQGAVVLIRAAGVESRISLT